MTKIEDFENAPVGATASHDNGSRAMKTPAGEWCWVLSNGCYRNDELMEDYTLDAPAPTTAREALDLAWELAHPVKEGQIIPEGARYLTSSGSGLTESIACVDQKMSPHLASINRTLEPLPDPEPEWLDAPAVLATCGCQGIELWHPHNEKDGRWVSSVRGEHAHWSSLRDVTPLYPKEGQDS